MSEISFPIKDLSRKRTQTILTILGLSISISITVFLISFGRSLSFEIPSTYGNELLTSGISNIFSQFILIITIINIISGLVITSFLIHLSISDRIQDIGIMKATGCISNSIFAIFFTELSLLIISSSTIGTLLGLGFYCVSIYLLNMLGFSIHLFLDVGLIIIIILFIIFFSHLFGILPIKKASTAKTTEALSPVFRYKASIGLLNKIPSRLGFTFKMAIQNLARRKSITIQIITCLFLVMTLTTLTMVGGMIANETTSSYVNRAIGNNVIVIGHPLITDRYINLLSEFFQDKELTPINYFNSDFFFSDSLISKLNEISGIQKVDPRFIFENVVQEVPGIILDPVEGSKPIVIGDIRVDEGLILGVNFENVVNDWLVLERKFEENHQVSAMIGDTLAVTIFSVPQNQSIRVLNILNPSPKNYPIGGICVDPLNNGKVVYLPIDELHSELDQQGYNILFIKYDNTKGTKILSQIETIISHENLQLVELNDVLDKNLKLLDNIWSLVMVLPFFSMVSAAISLFSYMILNISDQQQDFGIIRALGAKTRSIMKIVFYQTMIIILVGGFFGIFCGFYIVYNFLIIEPVISQSSLIVFFGIFFFLIPILIISTIFPTSRIIKKTNTTFNQIIQ